MAYANTTRLQLKKAVVGTNQAFETSEINNNWDKVDAETIAISDRIGVAEGVAAAFSPRIGTLESKTTALETLTASGTVHAATIAVSAGSATTAGDSAKLAGRTLFVQNSAPTAGMVTGDLWIQV
jgi:hypothetical protein